MPRNCRLHLRRPEDADVSRFLDAWTRVFPPELTYTVASDEEVPTPGLANIDVGLCSNGPSVDITRTFTALQPAVMGPDDVLVIFARQLTGSARLGCAEHPPGIRGVTISCGAQNPMVFPHEIAHLFLGRGHDGLASNLMFRNTDQLTLDPPSLTGAQLAALIAGAFVDWHFISLAHLTLAPAENTTMRRARASKKKSAKRRAANSDRSARSAGKKKHRGKRSRARASIEKAQTTRLATMRRPRQRSRSTRRR